MSQEITNTSPQMPVEPLRPQEADAIIDRIQTYQRMTVQLDGAVIDFHHLGEVVYRYADKVIVALEAAAYPPETEAEGVQVASSPVFVPLPDILALEKAAHTGQAIDPQQVIALIAFTRKLFVVADDIAELSHAYGVERHEHAARLDALRDGSNLDPLPDFDTHVAQAERALDRRLDGEQFEREAQQFFDENGFEGTAPSNPEAALDDERAESLRIGQLWKGTDGLVIGAVVTLRMTVTNVSPNVPTFDAEDDDFNEHIEIAISNVVSVSHDQGDYKLPE